MVTTEQRFRRYGEHCPICEGHAGLKQGRGERCAGFMSDDGEYVFCTREEFAGKLERNENAQPAAFGHKMHGPCNCGEQHGPDLKIVPPPSRGKSGPAGRIVNEYNYYDEHGRMVYQSVRYEPKTFKQRQPDGKGGWAWDLKGVTPLPYRLPELLKAAPDETIYIVEGEKDADRLAHAGLVATCNSGGAGKWPEEINRYFKGRHVVLLPDNDKAGCEHAQKVTKTLHGIAASVRTVGLPGLPDKGDVSDWFESKGTREELETLCAPRRRKFTYASEVKEEPIEWLWNRRLAKGCLTLLVGDPGLGKSQIIAKICEAVTTGKGLPDGGAITPGGVILMAPEEPASMITVPRLRANGVNLKKVLLLTEVPDFDGDGQPYNRPVSFPEDAHILAEAIADAGASVAIIDPLLDVLSEKMDAHRDHAVRQALRQVVQVAAQAGCALVGVVHLNKGQSANPLYRSSSSIAFIAMARVGLFVVPDPESEEKGGVLVNHKNNLAPQALSLRYSFTETEDKIGYITWAGESSYSDVELLNQQTPMNNKRSEQADELLALLKQHEEAMSAEEIVPLLKSGQTLDALNMMLSRKVISGEIMRPSRGKYTYVGNPLYDVSYVSSVKNVNSVRSVRNDEINTSNITNITNGHNEKERPVFDTTLQKEKRDDRGFFLTCQAENCFASNETVHNGLCKKHWLEMRERQHNDG